VKTAFSFFMVCVICWAQNIRKL